jgi:hypothetical protein
MTHSFKLSRRIARLRVPALAAIIAVVGCNSTDSVSPDSSLPLATGDSPAAAPAAPIADPSFSSSFAGGIPIGTFEQPTTTFGSLYNGAKENISPGALVSTLSAIRARGGKVVLMFAGSEQYYKDGSGHFSLTKWKERVNRYRNVNFTSYVSDGTIIGHYMIDEPHDPYNWNGDPISPSTLEEMAKYSKSIWPTMPTVVRELPHYLASWSGSYHYLDAAWAQYLARMGSPSEYIRYNVSEAQKKGLALIVGLNFVKGGNPNGTSMNASEVESYGSALLSSSYPCAFISYQYSSGYLSNSSIKSAMNVLRNKAENRSSKSCRGS